MIALSDSLALDCPGGTIYRSKSVNKTLRVRRLCLVNIAGCIETGLAGESKAEIDPRAETLTICGRWQKEDCP